MANRWETMETVTNFIFLGSKITPYGDCSHEIKRHLPLRRKAMTYLDSLLKSRDITLPTKVHLVKAIIFPVVMCGYELDCKESWVLKNWCFWTVVLEKTLESPLDCKEINPKGNQSWIFIGRTNAEASILWPPDGKSWLIWKDPDAGKDWRWEEKGMTEGWMASLTQWTKFVQTPGDDERQGSLLRWSPWSSKETWLRAWTTTGFNLTRQ